MESTASGNNYIQKLISESLDDVPFHSQVEWIERLVSTNLPVHLAVHKISDSKEMPIEYVQSHRHSHPELNIILGDDQMLTFKVQLGENTYVVESPSSIWIPSGMEHSAVATSGSGYFICLILKDSATSTYESLTVPP